MLVQFLHKLLQNKSIDQFIFILYKNKTFYQYESVRDYYQFELFHNYTKVLIVRRQYRFFFDYIYKYKFAFF